jgi:hypothetical protein
MSLAVMVAGSGAFSVDRALSGNKTRVIAFPGSAEAGIF